MVWVDVGRQKAQAQYRGLERGKRVKDWFQCQQPFLKRTESGQKRAVWVTAETCDLLEVAGMPTVNGWNCMWNASLYLSHGTTFPPEIGERSLGQGLLLMGCLSQKSFWKQGEELIILLHVHLGLPGACLLPLPPSTVHFEPSSLAKCKWTHKPSHTRSFPGFLLMYSAVVSGSAFHFVSTERSNLWHSFFFIVVLKEHNQHLFCFLFFFLYSSFKKDQSWFYFFKKKKNLQDGFCKNNTFNPRFCWDMQPDQSIWKSVSWPGAARVCELYDVWEHHQKANKSPRGASCGHATQGHWWVHTVSLRNAVQGHGGSLSGASHSLGWKLQKRQKVCHWDWGVAPSTEL